MQSLETYLKNIMKKILPTHKLIFDGEEEHAGCWHYYDSDSKDSPRINISFDYAKNREQKAWYGRVQKERDTKRRFGGSLKRRATFLLLHETAHGLQLTTEKHKDKYWNIKQMEYFLNHEKKYMERVADRFARKYIKIFDRN